MDGKPPTATGRGGKRGPGGGLVGCPPLRGRDGVWLAACDPAGPGCVPPRGGLSAPRSARGRRAGHVPPCRLPRRPRPLAAATPPTSLSQWASGTRRRGAPPPTCPPPPLYKAAISAARPAARSAASRLVSPRPASPRIASPAAAASRHDRCGRVLR